MIHNSLTTKHNVLTMKHNGFKLWHNAMTRKCNAFTNHCQRVPTHFHGITRQHWLLLCQVYENRVTFSPHSFHINSLLQLILHSFFQNCGQCWSPGSDKDACDSFHKVMKLTQKEMIEFLLDNYLGRNYNKLLKICSSKFHLHFYITRYIQKIFCIS